MSCVVTPNLLIILISLNFMLVTRALSFNIKMSRIILKGLVSFPDAVELDKQYLDLKKKEKKLDYERVQFYRQLKRL